MFIDFKHGAQQSEDFDPDSETRFRYLIKELGSEEFLPVGSQTVQALDALGVAMTDPTVVGATAPPTQQESTIPPIYTYWAQFLDHELTARTDRSTSISDITLDAQHLRPAERAHIEENLLNRRTPAIELDSIYGDGLPGFHGHRSRRVTKFRNFELARKLRDGAKMLVGLNTVTTWPSDTPIDKGQPGQPKGAVPPFAFDLQRDLPRIGALLDSGAVKRDDFPRALRDLSTFRQRALIADPRNDENLVVAQFHVAMLRFHNAVVDWLRFKDRNIDLQGTREIFEDARRIVRWTFQWLVVNDLLGTLLAPGTVEATISTRAQAYFRRSGAGRDPYMPLEFSVACYRFGHSMVRELYDYNRNFGRPEREPGKGFIAPASTLDQLFQFTGKSSTPFLKEAETLPHNWIIEWDRFDGSAPLPLRVARKIDTRLDFPLGALFNEGNGTPGAPIDSNVSAILKQLARRNLRRGYQLSLPTGQALAAALHIEPLSATELGGGNTDAVKQALDTGNFLKRTPLWFYTLKEAEVIGEGNRLGPVASAVIAETIIGVLLADPESYLVKKPDWTPGKSIPGAGGPLKLPKDRTIRKIGDLLEFAGVKPPPASGL